MCSCLDSSFACFFLSYSVPNPNCRGKPTLAKLVEHEDDNPVGAGSALRVDALSSHAFAAASASSFTALRVQIVRNPLQRFTFPVDIEPTVRFKSPTKPAIADFSKRSVSRDYPQKYGAAPRGAVPLTTFSSSTRIYVPASRNARIKG